MLVWQKRFQCGHTGILDEVDEVSVLWMLVLKRLETDLASGVIKDILPRVIC